MEAGKRNRITERKWNGEIEQQMVRQKGLGQDPKAQRMEYIKTIADLPGEYQKPVWKKPFQPFIPLGANKGKDQQIVNGKDQEWFYNLYRRIFCSSIKAP